MSFFVLLSLVISTTSVFAAEIVGRLSVHWSPKHHSAKHMKKMKADMKKGDSFKKAHQKALKKVGK